jgi:hypothetical protein
VRGLAITVALLVAAGALGGVASAARADREHSSRLGAPSGVDARVVGSFAMTGQVTVATNVRGERVGQRVTRTWRIIPWPCNGSVCQVLNLDRQRGGGLHDHVLLRRLRPGYYAGTGMFYAALRCRGRVYPHGSEVPYKLTLTVTRAVVVEGIAFAQQIVATYDSPGRLDSTPCPLGLSRDAASYAGTTNVPSPPVASFAETISGGTFFFQDSSAPGFGGSPIVGWGWDFGDPSSGPLDTSTARDPSHTFSAPGNYTVTLTVTAADGLTASTTQAISYSP